MPPSTLPSVLSSARTHAQAHPHGPTAWNCCLHLIRRANTHTHRRRRTLAKTELTRGKWIIFNRVETVRGKTDPSHGDIIIHSFIYPLSNSTIHPFTDPFTKSSVQSSINKIGEEIILLSIDPSSTCPFLTYSFIHPLIYHPSVHPIIYPLIHHPPVHTCPTNHLLTDPLSTHPSSHLSTDPSSNHPSILFILLLSFIYSLIHWPANPSLLIHTSSVPLNNPSVHPLPDLSTKSSIHSSINQIEEYIILSSICYLSSYLSSTYRFLTYSFTLPLTHPSTKSFIHSSIFNLSIIHSSIHQYINHPSIHWSIIQPFNHSSDMNLSIIHSSIYWSIIQPSTHVSTDHLTIHSLIHWSIRSIIQSSIHPIHSSIVHHLLTHLFISIQLFIHALIHSSIHPLLHPSPPTNYTSIHPLINPSNHSSIIHPPTCDFSHPLLHSSSLFSLVCQNMINPLLSFGPLIQQSILSPTFHSSNPPFASSVDWF